MRSFKDIERIFKNRGFTVFEEDYLGTAVPIKYICPNGHTGVVRVFDFEKRGVGCALCSNRVAYSCEFVRSFLKEHDYTLISMYKNSRTPIKYRCPRGHTNTTYFKDFKRGSRCPYCKGVGKKTFDNVKNLFEVEGYTVVSNKEDYKNSHSYVYYICPKGHLDKVKVYSFISGLGRCSTCAGTKKHTLEFIKRKFKDEYYIVLDNKYLGASAPIKIKCPNGHITKMTWNNFSCGARCKKCAGGRISKISLNWISSFNNSNIQLEYKIKEFGLFVDGFDPETNTVYEFLGDFWHGNPEVYNQEEINPVNKKVYGDLYKETILRLELLEESGYNVVYIWESDFRG